MDKVIRVVTTLAAYAAMVVSLVVLLLPSFLAGIAYQMDHSQWGWYVVLALFWFFLLSNFLSHLVSKAKDDSKKSD